jgi:hypothetical protein
VAPSRKAEVSEAGRKSVESAALDEKRRFCVEVRVELIAQVITVIALAITPHGG